MQIFSADQQKQVVDAISHAEAQTSGEIRVVVERKCKDSEFDRAAYYFKKLNMHKTALRNGVLIYIATDDHKFSIIGDQGINQRVEKGFWDLTKELMLADFKNAALIEGLIRGIQQVGLELKKFFPKQDDDSNELPNEIVFGKE